ncbi:MAG TPA: hypothetical protein VIG24_19830 [Acidimicrobiia bacterium]
MDSRGSVKRDTYYKVQVWEERSFAWKDIQRAHMTADEARDAFPAGRSCRVMEISKSGRHSVA